jgi:hypothetical protein
MRRASIERPRTEREWKSRQSLDEALEPGRFRKGRTASGCPRKCGHCRAIKDRPKLRTILADLKLREWLESEWPS